MIFTKTYQLTKYKAYRIDLQTSSVHNSSRLLPFWSLVIHHQLYFSITPSALAMLAALFQWWIHMV